MTETETATPALSTDLRVAVNRLSRRLRAQKADPSITDGQFSALARLHRDGPMTLADLSRAEGVSAPAMTKTGAALVDRGLVSRTGHDDDRRKVVLGTTDTGRALVLDTRRRRDGWLTPRLQALSPAERRTLTDAVDLLRRLEQQ